MFVVYCQVPAVPSHCLQQGNCSVGTVQVNYGGARHHEVPNSDPAVADSLAGLSDGEEMVSCLSLVDCPEGCSSLDGHLQIYGAR